MLRIFIIQQFVELRCRGRRPRRPKKIKISLEEEQAEKCFEFTKKRIRAKFTKRFEGKPEQTKIKWEFDFEEEKRA